MTFLTLAIFSISTLLTIIYVVISEILLIGTFTNEYIYFRKIYKNYMPGNFHIIYISDKILSKEKRIKFWLIKHDILNR